MSRNFVIKASNRVNDPSGRLGPPLYQGPNFLTLFSHVQFKLVNRKFLWFMDFFLFLFFVCGLGGGGGGDLESPTT